MRQTGTPDLTIGSEKRFRTTATKSGNDNARSEPERAYLFE